jgi:hypothetical protein
MSPNVVAPKSFFRQLLALQDFWMNSNDEDLFVMRPIENPNSSTLRKTLHRTPEEIMIQLRCTRVLETENLTALGINSRHYMLDDAIFAGCVHGLKYEKRRVAVVRV